MVLAPGNRISQQRNPKSLICPGKMISGTRGCLGHYPRRYEPPRTNEQMASFFHALIEWIGAHPTFAFVAVFILALSEAIPVIGTVVPGSTTIIGISALATRADVNLWLLLIAATVGAICGDGQKNKLLRAGTPEPGYETKQSTGKHVGRRPHEGR